MNNILLAVTAWISQEVSKALSCTKLKSILVIVFLSSSVIAHAAIVKINIEGSVAFGGPVIDDGTRYSASFIVDNSVELAPLIPSPTRTTFQKAILDFTMDIAGVTIILDDFNERNDINQFRVDGPDDQDQVGLILGNTLDTRPGRDGDALSGILNGFNARDLTYSMRGGAGELYSDRDVLLDAALYYSNSSSFELVQFGVTFTSLEAPFLAYDIALLSDSIFISEVSDEPPSDVPTPATLYLMLSGTAIMLLAAGRRKARRKGPAC